MRKKIIYTLLTLMVLSCKTTNNLSDFQGEIFIKLIDVRSLVANINDEELKKFKENSFNEDQINYSEAEKKSNAYFKILIENELLKKPFFKLKINSEKIINVYTTKIDIQKLEKEIDNLNKETEKIIVKFSGYKVSDGVYDSDGIFDQPVYIANRIIYIEKTTGKTDWEK